MQEFQKDCGWAWMTLLGAGTCMFLVVGGFKTIGILFVEFRNAFGATAAMTAAMMGVTTAFMSLCAPPVSMLGERYTYRMCAMIGGALGAMAMFLAAFATNIYFVIFVFGTITGISYAFMFAPSLVLLSMYFDKRRSLANGMAMAGASVGQLVIPQLLNLLLAEYSLMGTLIIYSGVCLNGVVAGALLRPVALNRTLKVKDHRAVEDPPAPDEKEINHGADGDVVNMDGATAQADAGQQNGVETTCIAKKAAEKKTTGFLAWVRTLYDWSLFSNFLFLAYIVGIMLGNVGYVNPFQLIPPHAEDIGISSDDTATLLSVIGAFDLFGRVFGGWFADLGFLKRNNLMAGSIIFTGLTLIGYTFFEGYVGLLIFCVVLGLIGGFYISLMAVVCLDFVGAEKFAAAFGLTVLFMGLSNTGTPILLGYIRDTTGSYQGAWWTCGIFMILGGVAFASEPWVRPLQERWENRKKARKNTTPLPESETLVTSRSANLA